MTSWLAQHKIGGLRWWSSSYSQSRNSIHPKGRIPLSFSRDRSRHSSVTGEVVKIDLGIDTVSCAALGNENGSVADDGLDTDTTDSGIDTVSCLVEYRFLSSFFLGLVSLCFLPILHVKQNSQC